MPIPVADIFAGPGGLGEGFSAFQSARGTAAFRIAVSAEKEAHAAKTLRLRAFFRQFPPDEVPASYYEYVAGHRQQPWTDKTEKQWKRACDEARPLELGNPRDDELLDERILAATRGSSPWVLIGGPPCQAYSLVGRARNKGIPGYAPETDDRHFLYRHYLRIITEFRPTAFVMENVKGILSSKVGGARIFPRIMEDLMAPGGRRGPKYRIVPIIAEDNETSGVSRYLVKAEQLGIPQARHRVILLGISEEIDSVSGKRLIPQPDRWTVRDTIGGMPALRSGLTSWSVSSWESEARRILKQAGNLAKTVDEEVRRYLVELSGRSSLRSDPGMGERWTNRTSRKDRVPSHLVKWLIDPRIQGYANHTVRSHMHADLMRYAYAAAYGNVHGRSPKGEGDFPVALHPNHASWGSGKFMDRFKVQIFDRPSSTVTSHLQKDGHYFIHPDPSQLRSLSVREAARLQTFPDNYFFEGPMGAQFRQVGNAVPPWLAIQIAGVVHSFLS